MQQDKVNIPKKYNLPITKSTFIYPAVELGSFPEESSQASFLSVPFSSSGAITSFSSCLLVALSTYLYAKEGCEDNIGDDDQVHLMTVIVTLVMTITMTVTMTITIKLMMMLTMIIVMTVTKAVTMTVMTVTMIIRMTVMMMMMTIMMTEIMLMTIRARPTSLRKLRVIRITRIRYMMENTPSVTPCEDRFQPQ